MKKNIIFNTKFGRSKRRAFTLIELLIVIAIIGLLSSIVMASLNKAKAKGLDAKRIADIKAFQTALEMYYDKNNQYLGFGGVAPVPSCTTCTENHLSGALQPYLPSMPIDPIYKGTVYGYRYYPVAINSSYQEYTILIYKLGSSNTWCSISVPPNGGLSSWNPNHPSNTTGAYPVCANP